MALETPRVLLDRDDYGDSLVDRAKAGQRHLNWLLTETGMTEERPYPFPDEAEAFAEVYRTTKLAVGSPDTGSGDVPAVALRRD